MPVGWLRYGVKTNPFTAPVLDCVRKPEHRDLFSNLFFDDETEAKLDGALNGAIQSESPALYVVTGPSGSGRTAYARHIAFRYARIRGFEPAKFAFAEHDPIDNVSAAQVLHKLIARLGTAMKAVDKALNTTPSEELRTFLADHPSDNYSLDNLQTKIEQLSRDLIDVNAGFGCLLENVPDAKMLDPFRNLFESCAAVAVCTIRKADPDEVLVLPKGFIEIEMPPLTQSQTWEALRHRWEKFQATPPLPLPAGSVQSRLATPPPTIGRLLAYAAMIFDIKLTSHRDGDLYPADDLKFDDIQLKDALDLARQYYKGGGSRR